MQSHRFVDLGCVYAIPKLIDNTFTAGQSELLNKEHAVVPAAIRHFIFSPFTDSSTQYRSKELHVLLLLHNAGIWTKARLLAKVGSYTSMIDPSR
jgi:hypothetical protein